MNFGSKCIFIVFIISLIFRTDGKPNNMFQVDIFSNFSQNEQNILGKIMNGAIGTDDMFPYMVSIQTSSFGQHICGGTLLTPYHILTAAHCVFIKPFGKQFNPNDLQIRIGPSNLRQLPNTVARIKWIKIHEEYKKRPIVNDIAVLKVDRSLTSSNSDIPPLSTSFITPRTVSGPCVAAGWGRIGPDPSLAEYKSISDDISNSSSIYNDSNQIYETGIVRKDIYLRFTLLPLQEVSECSKDYEIPISKDAICAGRRNSKTDTCKGDSGGPLICDGRIEGIISFGDGCDNPEHLGVYTRVYIQLKWIQKQINSGPNVIFQYKSFLISFNILCIIFKK